MSGELEKKGEEYNEMCKKYETANAKYQEARKNAIRQEESIGIMTGKIKKLESELAEVRARSPPRYVQPADIMGRERGAGRRERDRARSKSKYVR